MHVKLAAEAGHFPFVIDDLPVNAPMTLGSAAAAAAGRGGESVFATTDCKLAAKGMKLTCRH